MIIISKLYVATVTDSLHNRTDEVIDAMTSSWRHWLALFSVHLSEVILSSSAKQQNWISWRRCRPTYDSRWRAAAQL